MPAVAGRMERAIGESVSLDLEAILALVRPVATSLHSAFHGEDHWRDVAIIGLQLAERTPGCDAIALVVFAVLHDARRIGDDDDPGHGARGARLVRSLALGRFGLEAEQLGVVEAACRDHTGGAVSDDPTIGTCWDADRLTLGRVGIEPAARYMSTAAGKLAASSGERFPRTRDWSLVSRRIRARGSTSRPDRLRTPLRR